MAADTPHPSGNDRYAIYTLVGGKHERIAETSEEGVIPTIRTLRDEEQIAPSAKVGILDRETREWLVNPWATGSAW